MRRAAFAAILLVVTGCANPQAGPTAPGRQALRVADVTLMTFLH